MTEKAARSITVEQLERLMGGMSVDPPRGFGEVTARDF
jgi:transposase